MTDAVLRFVVELSDQGLGKLKSELKQVSRLGAETASSTTKSGSQATASLNRIAQSEASSAKRSVENAARRHAVVRRQIGDYQAIARASVRGSDEEIAANMLAAKAQRRLARETGLMAAETTVAYGRAGAASRHYERDLSRIGRGVLSASGLVRGLGRSLAFASGAFLGGVGVTFALRSIVQESAKNESVQKRLRAQLAASGISWRKNGGEIDLVVAKQTHLAGVEDEDVKSALTDLIRTTGSVRAGEKLLQSTLDVSAGKHISLTAAAGLEARVFSGNLGILKRYGIVLSKDVKTPLEALIAVQKKFAGQAEAAGNATAGAFGRAKNSIHNFEEGLGAGILPVLRDRLNALTGAIDDQQLKAKAKELGETIAHDVDGAISEVVRDVRQNWPEIKRDFEDTKLVIGETAKVAGTLAHWLHEIADIVPAKGSLIELLVGGALAKRLVLGKGAKTAAAGEGAGGGGALGLVESLLAGLGLGGAAKKAGAARGAPLLRLAVPVLVSYELHENKQSVQGFLNRVSVDARNWVHKQLGPLGFLTPAVSPQASPFGGPPAHAAPRPPAGALGPVETKTAAIAVQTRDVATSWNAVKDALRATGAGLDQQKSKLEQIVASEKRAAQAAASALDEAFGRLVDDVGRAFDAKTQQMLDNVSYRVRVVGQGIHEAFTLRGDELTPAERELAALDKIEQRRNFKRDIFDARKALAEAIQVGDPVKIREAERQLQDAQTEKRRFGLQKRAELERKAADAAKARAEKELQARRDLEKRQLDDQLAGILKAAEQGKLGGKKAVKEILDVLRSHGLDFKAAGALLGAAFSTQLQQDLGLVSTRANRVADAFERIARTRQRIHELTQEVAQLAAQLSRVQKNGPAELVARRETGVHPEIQAGLPPASGGSGSGTRSRTRGGGGTPGGGSAPGPTPPPARRQPPAPPGAPGPDRRERRHRKDIEELVSLRPGHRMLAQAIEALHFHVRLPRKIDERYLRLLGRRTSVPHLEKLIGYIEAARLGGLPHAEGGVIEGPPGRDVIHALLTRKELVLNDDQQQGLKRRLGVRGGPRELFDHIRGLAQQRYAGGGVVGYASGGVAGDSGFSRLLRDLTRKLARLELGQNRAQQNPQLIGELLGTIKASKAERARARHALDPVHIEELVGHSAAGRGLSKRGRLRLEQRLSQEQAHPFIEHLLRADPTGTALGAAGRSGRALPGRGVSGLPGLSHAGGVTITIDAPIYLDGEKIGDASRSHQLKHSQRGYTRKRGANRGSNLGLS
jgi:hypothetical protein